MKARCVFFIFLFFADCSSSKRVISIKGNQNDAIQIAINDFFNSGGLSRKDSVFSVAIKNINDDVLGVSILGARNKIAVVTENEVDYDYRAFPTKYFEKRGVLFYWKDSTAQVPKELVNRLYEMHRVDTAIIGKLFPERTIDEKQKGTDYYFCRNDLSRHKKVITSKGMGYYDPPKLECSIK